MCLRTIIFSGYKSRFGDNPQLSSLDATFNISDGGEQYCLSFCTAFAQFYACQLKTTRCQGRAAAPAIFFAIRFSATHTPGGRRFTKLYCFFTVFGDDDAGMGFNFAHARALPKIL